MIHAFESSVPKVDATAFVAWNAEVVGDVELGEGSSVWYGATLRGDVNSIRVGRRSNVQDGAVLHVASSFPCVIGEGVTVGHRAVVHACRIGDWSLVGMGAVVLDGAEIGQESIVGAGALVTQGKSFPPRTLILGSPAKAVRALTTEEAEHLHAHAIAYSELASRAAAGTREA